MIGLLLYLVARLIGVVVMPIGVIYSLIKAGRKDYFLTMAISFDQFGNVVMGKLFNDILIKPNRDLFGHEDETISSVLGKNQLNGTLRPLGKLLVRILDKFEKNHSIKSIE